MKILFAVLATTTAGLVWATAGHATAAFAHDEASTAQLSDEPDNTPDADDRLRGEPIEGADSSTDAPLVEPGRYTDTVRGEGTSRYYTIDVPDDGGLLVTVTGHPEHIPGGASNEYLAVELLTPDGTSCSDFEGALRDTDVSAVLSTGVILSPHVASEPDPACAAASRLLIHVSNRGDAEPYPIELTAWTFPGVHNADSLPEVADDEEVYDGLRRATASGEAGEVTGGTSLSTAPALDPGVYRDSIQPGQQRIYRVRADWGQTPLFTATLGADTHADSVLGNSSVRVRARWASPVRHIIDAQSNPDNDVADSVRYGGQRPATITAAIPQIRFLNQGADSAYVGTASMPGYYYFIVEADQFEGAGGLSIPFQLQVEVAGDVSGAPDFAGELLGPEDEVPEAAGEGSGGGSFPWLAASLITLGAVLMLAAAVLVTATSIGRRRA